MEKLSTNSRSREQIIKVLLYSTSIRSDTLKGLGGERRYYVQVSAEDIRHP